MNGEAPKKTLSDAAIYITAAVLAAIAAAGVLLCVLCAAAYIPFRAEIDLGERHQTLTGFGASSAWYWQDMGANASEETVDETVRLLYGDDGLGLNIFRYNVGGGSADAEFDGVAPYNYGWFDSFRRAESFFVAENVPSSDREDVEAVSAAFRDESNYDFATRDAAVRSMFAKSLATGNVDKVVFFANSPHYLMTESGMCTGAYEYQNNLKPEFYEAFADYLLIITYNLYETYLADLETVPEVAISPVNEPQWAWGGEGSSQEGCHYDPEELAAFADVMWTRLVKFNAEHGTDFELELLESGNIAFSESNDIRAYLAALDDYEWFGELETISVHDYWVNGDKEARYVLRGWLDRNYPDLSVAATEFCEMEHGEFDTIESGIFLAQVVLRDLTMLDATEWSWWLSMAKGGYNDGLVYWNSSSAKADGAGLYTLKRYSAFAQFTRYLDKGDVRVGCELVDPFGAYDIDIGVFVKEDGRVAVVAVNAGEERSLKLSGMGAFEGREATEAVTTADEDVAERTFVFDGSVTLRAKSVTTFVFPPA